MLTEIEKERETLIQNVMEIETLTEKGKERETLTEIEKD